MAKKVAKKQAKAPTKAQTKAGTTRAESGTRAETPTPPVPRSVQRVHAEAVREFDQALGAVAREDWEGARRAFDDLLCRYPAEMEILDRARTYRRIAERRLAARPAPPRTADEHYHVGIYQLNAGQLDEAVAALTRALELDRRADKVPYAMAVVLAQKGQAAEALRHLRQAIELNPDNRVFAANDNDFDLLREESAFVELVSGGTPGPGPGADNAPVRNG